MTKCDRCKAETKNLSGSYFNTEMICPVCEEKEKNHSEYENAKRIEAANVKRGNMNFPGIGLPEDLKIK